MKYRETPMIPLDEVRAHEVNVLGVEFRPKTNKVPFTPAQRAKILEFGAEYWDDPSYPGCRGYKNDGRWAGAAQKILSHFKLGADSSMLDVCCGKGYLLEEIATIAPAVRTTGIDISRYALTAASPTIRPFLVQSSAAALPFRDRSFDLAVSLNSLYILPEDACRLALREMGRVAHKAFVQVNSYRTEQERENLLRWDASVNVARSVEEWQQLFSEVDFRGYFYWTIFL